MDDAYPHCSHDLDAILHRPVQLSNQLEAHQQSSTLPAVLNHYHSIPKQGDNLNHELNQAASTGSAQEQINGAEEIEQQHESMESFPVPRRSQIAEFEAPDVELKLREYQREVSVEILKGRNDIIVLPTGTGKTAVAINLIITHLRLFHQDKSKRKILFFTPTVVLAEQQLNKIKVNLPREWAQKCRKITGGDLESLDELEQVLLSEEWWVIVATPQTVCNYFEGFKTSSIKRFSLLIFDECHAAVRAQPYNKLLYQYMDEKYKGGGTKVNLPQLIGLTATIGVGDAKDEIKAKDHMLALCARFDLESPPTEVKDFKDQLDAIRNPPVKELKIVEENRGDPFSTYIKETIMNEIQCNVESMINSNLSLRLIHFRTPKDVMSIGYRSKCDRAINELSKLHDRLQNAKASTCIIAIEFLKVFSDTLYWANLALLSDALRILKECIEKPRYQSHLFYRRYKAEWLPYLQHVEANELRHYGNEKLEVLKEQIYSIMHDYTQPKDGKSRLMIFVGNRRLTFLLRDWINNLDPSYKCERLVSTLIAPSEYGITKEESQRVMDNFRSGGTNILVATTVIAEGVDVPECNGVIRYLYLKDVIAEVQMPGRMRARGGKVVAIVDEKLREEHQSHIRMEAVMYRALQQIREIPLSDFKAKMRDIQDLEHAERHHPRPQGNLRPSTKLRDAEIHCKLCGFKIGQLADINVYLRCHYLILDPRLTDKVEVKEDNEYVTERMAGISETGVLLCLHDKCESVLGKVIKIKLNGTDRRLGIWKIKKIRFVGDETNYSKWETATKKYIITQIKHEDLRNKVSEGCCINIED